MKRVNYCVIFISNSLHCWVECKIRLQKLIPKSKTEKRKEFCLCVWLIIRNNETCNGKSGWVRDEDHPQSFVALSKSHPIHQKR